MAKAKKLTKKKGRGRTRPEGERADRSEARSRAVQRPRPGRAAPTADPDEGRRDVGGLRDGPRLETMVVVEPDRGKGTEPRDSAPWSGWNLPRIVPLGAACAQ